MKRPWVINSDKELLEKAKTFFLYDNEFHKCIFSSLNKVELWSYTVALIPDYVRFRIMITEFYTIDDLNTLLGEHHQILDFISQKDITSIKEVYKLHINGGINFIQKIIEEKEDYFFI